MKIKPKKKWKWIRLTTRHLLKAGDQLQSPKDGKWYYVGGITGWIWDRQIYKDSPPYRRRVRAITLIGLLCYLVAIAVVVYVIIWAGMAIYSVMHKIAPPEPPGNGGTNAIVQFQLPPGFTVTPEQMNAAVAMVQVSEFVSYTVSRSTDLTNWTKVCGINCEREKIDQALQHVLRSELSANPTNCAFYKATHD